MIMILLMIELEWSRSWARSGFHRRSRSTKKRDCICDATLL